MASSRGQPSATARAGVRAGSGWVACNGTTGDLTGLAVPNGQARIIDHDNYKTPDGAALVTSFDLPLHRGVVLLKDGRTLGNQG